MNHMQQAQELYARHATLLACPFCYAAMTAGQGSLRCEHGHSFDFARSGYVNLFTGRPNEDYDAALFAARAAVCAEGFFDAMLDALANLISEHAPQARTMLDAGCGEGSHLLALLERLQEKGLKALGVGVDIAKPGIDRAARRGGALWAVADLARLPFAPGSFGAVVNILSPARYDEFARVMAPGGVLVKVLPGKGYLRELREALGAPDYDNADVAAHFAERFDAMDRRAVTTEMDFAGQALRDLLAMTPLAWNAPPERMQALLDHGTLRITADFLLLSGRCEKR